jgi:hypothetical protein
VPIVNILRKLYIKNLFSLEKLEKFYQDGHITALEKKYILTGSYEEAGDTSDTDAGAGDNTVKE